MEHVNHFIREIGIDNRRQFTDSILATRVAGAEEKSYRRFMNHLKQQERQVQAVQKGRKFMTYEEQMKLESQRHVKFNQMSAAEQERLEAERTSMWGQIPEHLQAKARKMAGR